MTRPMPLLGALVVLATPALGVAQAPDGWTYRLDAPQMLVDTQAVAPGEWRYTRMPPGWHVTTTEQGVYLFPEEHTVSGRWAVECELFLFPNPSAAPLGLVVEAATREPGEVQLRFMMRRDGQAAVIGHRAGVDTVLAPWTADTAAAPHTGGVDKYVLRLSYEAGWLAFQINGREMHAFQVGSGNEEVRPGLRIGPGLNVHVARFDLVTPLAPPRRRDGM